MTDASTPNTVLYHDIYTAARSQNIITTEQLVFLLAALFIAAIFVLLCFAVTIMVTKWIVTGDNCHKSKCTGDEEEHYRMRQEVSEWKMAQERLRVDLERKMDRERDTGAHKSPSTVIKIDQPPPTIIERGRDCHASAPDMSQFMSLIGQRPLIQTVFSQPSVPMGMPMQPGYNPYQPQAMPPPQGYPFPQQPVSQPSEAQVAKRKKTSSASPSEVLPMSMSTTRATLTPTPTSASSPRKSKKRHRHTRSRTPSRSRSRSHSKSPANYPISKTVTKDDTPSTFSTVTTTSKTDLPELTDSSGDHRTESTMSVSSHTSDLTEFSDVPAAKPRPNQRSIGQRHRHRRRSKSRTPSKSPTPSSKTNNDLMEFSDSSRKGSSKQSDSTVSSVPSTSTVSTTLTPEKQKSPSPLKSKSSSASRSPSSPMKLVKSNKGSADSTLSVEMSPSAEKEEKKVVKVVELQFKPATAAATMAMLAKYQKTKNRHQQNRQFELVPEESDSPLSTTDLGTSISSSVSSVTTSTMTPVPKEKKSPPKTTPLTTTTKTSPTTSTWTPRPPDVVSTPLTTSKTTDKTSPATTTGVSTSPIEKIAVLPNSPASSLRSDTSRVSSPEMKLEVTQNDESEKHLRRNVPVRFSFAGALVDNLAKHGKADNKKAATWRYQFVPDDTKLPKVFRQAPTLPAPELPVDVTQEDESIRREATLHRLHVHPRTIGGVIHTQAARGKFDSTAFAVNEQFVVVPDDEGFRSESQSTQSSAPSTISTSQPIPQPTTTKPKSTSAQTPNIADKIYQSRNPYWRARIDETAPTHDIANIRHILSPQVETAISKPPSATSPDPSMLGRSRSSRRHDSLTVSAESVVMPAPLNRGLFVRPGPPG